jgi:hypothetical protein
MDTLFNPITGEITQVPRHELVVKGVPEDWLLVTSPTAMAILVDLIKARNELVTLIRRIDATLHRKGMMA